MASISALGIGSGVLTSDLVDQLVKAERQVSDVRLDRRAERAEAQISAFGALRSAITELRLPMRQLGAPDAMRSFAANVSGGGVQVNVDSGRASRGVYTVDVKELAQGQALASRDTFSDRTTTSVGQGTLSLQVGDNLTTITIDSSNDSLQGLANAINNANAGVSAGIIDTGNGFQLVLSADETGTANAVQIDVTEAAGQPGLARFAFNDSVPPGEGLRETIEAKDAVMELNGVEIRRATNTIEGVVEGLTFNLEQLGQSTVRIEQDVEKPIERVEAFVEQFNNLQKLITELTRFNPEQGEGSLLTGDPTIRNIQAQLRRVVTDIVPGLEGGAVRSLADVGITSDAQTGELRFNKQRFETQLRNNTSDVTALFAERGKADDPQVEFIRSGPNTRPGNFDINVTQLATRGSVSFDLSAFAGGVTVTEPNNLSLRVDGATDVSLSLAAGTYSSEQLVAALQSELDQNAALRASGRVVQVAVSAAGELSFTSGRFGSESLVSVQGASGFDGALTVKSGDSGQDVQGTINGEAARGDGQVLFLPSSSTGPAAGIQVRILGGDLGNRGSISFVSGIAQRAVTTITDLVSATGALSARTDALNRELEQVEEDRARLDLRIESFQARLIRQFSVADSLIAQLNNTGDFVSQQLEALAPQNNRRK